MQFHLQSTVVPGRKKNAAHTEVYFRAAPPSRRQGLCILHFVRLVYCIVLCTSRLWWMLVRLLAAYIMETSTVSPTGLWWSWFDDYYTFLPSLLGVRCSTPEDKDLHNVPLLCIMSSLPVHQRRFFMVLLSPLDKSYRINSTVSLGSIYTINSIVLVLHYYTV